MLLRIVIFIAMTLAFVTVALLTAGLHNRAHAQLYPPPALPGDMPMPPPPPGVYAPPRDLYREFRAWGGHDRGPVGQSVPMCFQYRGRYRVLVPCR